MMAEPVEFILGFSGTQIGMTPTQESCFTKIVSYFHNKYYAVFIHGDCIGSDCQAHEIAARLGMPIEIYPPSLSDKRAFCGGARKIWPIAHYLARNRQIAKRCNALIITPKEADEQLRSGTWSTYRYAKAQDKSIYIVRPDGTLNS